MGFPWCRGTGCWGLVLWAASSSAHLSWLSAEVTMCVPWAVRQWISYALRSWCSWWTHSGSMPSAWSTWSFAGINGAKFHLFFHGAIIQSGFAMAPVYRQKKIDKLNSSFDLDNLLGSTEAVCSMERDDFTGLSSISNRACWSTIQVI